MLLNFIMVDVFGQGLQDIAENCTKVAIWWAGEVAYLGDAQIYVSFYSGASLGDFGAPVSLLPIDTTQGTLTSL